MWYISFTDADSRKEWWNLFISWRDSTCSFVLYILCIISGSRMYLDECTEEGRVSVMTLETSRNFRFTEHFMLVLYKSHILGINIFTCIMHGSQFYWLRKPPTCRKSNCLAIQTDVLVINNLFLCCYWQSLQ